MSVSAYYVVELIREFKYMYSGSMCDTSGWRVDFDTLIQKRRLTDELSPMDERIARAIVLYRSKLDIHFNARLKRISDVISIYEHLCSCREISGFEISALFNRVINSCRNEDFVTNLRSAASDLFWSKNKDLRTNTGDRENSSFFTKPDSRQANGWFNRQDSGQANRQSNKQAKTQANNQSNIQSNKEHSKLEVELLFLARAYYKFYAMGDSDILGEKFDDIVRKGLKDGKISQASADVFNLKLVHHIIGKNLLELSPNLYLAEVKAYINSLDTSSDLINTEGFISGFINLLKDSGIKLDIARKKIVIASALYSLGEATGYSGLKSDADRLLESLDIGEYRWAGGVEVVTYSDGCSTTRYGSLLRNMDKLGHKK